MHAPGTVRERDKAGHKTDWSGTLTPAQLEYVARNADVLLPLYRALDGKIPEADLSMVAKIEQDCLPAMVWLADSGVAFDAQTWHSLGMEAATEAKRLAEELDAAAAPYLGAQPHAGKCVWDNSADVKKVFLAAGFDLDSTKGDVLATIDHPLASLLRRYRSVMKLVSTYGAKWAKFLYSGRVFADWEQIGAESGRMSCGTPNLQSLPRDKRYRRCFVAPPGRVLVKADYSQIELRIVAKWSNDQAMLAAYRDGLDLHVLTARHVLGITEVTAEQRQLAKALNFGLLYGMGTSGFRDYAKSRYDLDLTEEQARTYRDGFFNTYPGLIRWHRSVPNYPVETRTSARRRRSNVEEFTQKLNTPVQGTNGASLRARTLSMSYRIAGKQAVFDSSSSSVDP
jgi:DNA polymerase-1